MPALQPAARLPDKRWTACGLPAWRPTKPRRSMSCSTLLAWKEAQGDTFDLVALLQPTTPVRARKHWDEALTAGREAGHDAAIGVGPAQSHPHLTFRMDQSRQLLPWIAATPCITARTGPGAGACGQRLAVPGAN